MTHPFNLIPSGKLKSIFLPLLMFTIGLMLMQNIINSPLETSAAPYGIISFELAGSIDRARQILSSWDTPTQLNAAFGLGLDFLFLLTYSTTIGMACIWSAEALRRRGWLLAFAGAPLAWGQWLAALLDAIENVALISTLLGTAANPFPQLAFWCAVVKFTLVFTGMVYGFFGLVVRYIVPTR